MKLRASCPRTRLPRLPRVNRTRPCHRLRPWPPPPPDRRPASWTNRLRKRRRRPHTMQQRRRLGTIRVRPRQIRRGRPSMGPRRGTTAVLLPGTNGARSPACLPPASVPRRPGSRRPISPGGRGRCRRTGIAGRAMPAPLQRRNGPLRRRPVTRRKPRCRSRWIRPARQTPCTGRRRRPRPFPARTRQRRCRPRRYPASTAMTARVHLRDPAPGGASPRANPVPGLCRRTTL